MTTTAEVKARMESMTRNKEKELAEIRQNRAEAARRLGKARDAKWKAMEEANAPEYFKASEELRKAEATVNMYNERLDMLTKKEFVSEQESDETISGLLEYEESLGDKFIADIKKPLEKVFSILNEYLDSVEDTEQTIRTWESTIHANYRSELSTKRQPDGSWGNRSSRPVPVHIVPFKGVDVAVCMQDFQKRIVIDDTGVSMKPL